MVSVTKSMPPRTQWAIDRLAKALRSEGYEAAQVGVNMGKPGHASLFDEEGNQTFYMFQDGQWYALGDAEV